MTADKAYQLLQQCITEMNYNEGYEETEIFSMALETLYEKAKDYDNMLVVAIEQQVAREEMGELTF